MSTSLHPPGRALLKLGLVSALGLALAAPIAQAQVSADQPTELEPVIVTGTLIPTADVIGATPVEVFSAEEIQRTGSQTVLQLTRRLPIVMGGGNISESLGNGGDGTARVELRGIPGGTLVLINGRRVAPTAFAGSQVDINSIPVAAIERIEILKDGGSSLYGSDAIAGVVNIILRKNFNGTQLDAYYGNTIESDVAEQRYSFVTGFANDQTSILVGGNYYRANSLFSNDRERSFGSATSGTSNPGRFRVRNDARGGGELYNPAAAPDAPVFVTVNRSAVPNAQGQFAPADFHRTGGNDAEAVYPGDTFPFPIYTPAIRPSERYSFFGNASHDLFNNDMAEFFVEASYTKSESLNELAPTPILSQIVGFPIPAGNFYNPFGVDIPAWGYRTAELGPRTENVTYDYFRFLPGVRGKVGDSSWNWEVAMLYSESRGAQRLGGELSRSRLRTAINDTTASAFNVFGIQRNSPAQLAAVAQPLYDLGKSTLWSVDGRVGGNVFELPGGPLALAVGAEHREERGEDVPDGPTQGGDTVGFLSASTLFGSRDVDAVFGEVKIPVFGPEFNVPGFHNLTLGAGFRYEDYSDFGSTVNPKVTLRWQPVGESITLRASYSTSFKAPTFGDLYTARQQSFPDVRNPYTAVFDQIQSFYSGNPDLQPQEAVNYTAGIVWTPMAERLDGLKVGVDWFRIEQESIPGGSPQYIADQNFRTGGPANAVPNPAYDPTQPASAANSPTVAGVNPTPGQFSNLIVFDPVDASYTSIDVPTLNLSRTIVEGLDLSLSYDLPTSWGTFAFDVLATYYYTFDQETIPGSGFVDRLGDYSNDDFGFGSTPRLRGIASVFWTYEGVELGVTANYTHSYRDDLLAADREIDSIVTFDLQASYSFSGANEWLDGTKVTVGVINVGDEPPPLALGSFSDNYDRTMHDLRQRFVYASLSKKF